MNLNFSKKCSNMMEAVKDKPYTVLPVNVRFIIFDMFSRPKVVYLAIKSRLLHVICTLYSTVRGLREVFCVNNNNN